MELFQGLVLIALGAGLLALDGLSLRTGWLPCGSDGRGGRQEFTQARQPLRYWVMFVAYAAGGCWILGTGAGILVGWIEPLPLR